MSKSDKEVKHGADALIIERLTKMIQEEAREWADCLEVLQAAEIKMMDDYGAQHTIESGIAALAAERDKWRNWCALKDIALRKWLVADADGNFPDEDRAYTPTLSPIALKALGLK